MKYNIERNTVQGTLVSPIDAGNRCSENYTSLFRDETGGRCKDDIDYDFSALAKRWKSRRQQF